VTAPAASGWLAAVAAAASLAIGIPSAHAGECSHGGGDSGGSSDGSSGGSSGGSSSSSDASSDSSSSSDYTDSSASSTTTVTPAGCAEVSDVVGYSQCRDFGDGWSAPARLPAISIELGTFARRLGPRLAGATGTMSHDLGGYSYRVIDPVDSGPTAVAMGTELRLTMATPPGVYFGVETEIGGMVRDAQFGVEMSSPPPTTADGRRPTVTTEQRLYVSGGGVVGVHHRFGRTMLGAELGGGVRTVQVAVRSQLGACDITDFHYASEGYVEPRVRLDYWANPWFTLGMFAGGDLRHHGAMIGAQLTVHLRAFDHSW
jgi:hypothetical protein